MLITFFVEHYGYFFDQELISANAGYVRNAFVLASLGEYSEYEALELTATAYDNYELTATEYDTNGKEELAS